MGRRGVMTKRTAEAMAEVTVRMTAEAIGGVTIEMTVGVMVDVMTDAMNAMIEETTRGTMIRERTEMMTEERMIEETRGRAMTGMMTSSAVGNASAMKMREENRI